MDFETKADREQHLALKVCGRPCLAKHNHSAIAEWFPTEKAARKYMQDKQLDRHLVVNHGGAAGAVYLRCHVGTKGRRAKSARSDEDEKENEAPSPAAAVLSRPTAGKSTDLQADNPAGSRRGTVLSRPASGETPIKRKRPHVKEDRRECPAHLRIRRATDGRFLLSGCLTHSHEKDHKSARLTVEQRKKVDQLVAAGTKPNHIYNKFFGTKMSNCDSDGIPLKAICRNDIWNRRRLLEGDRLRKVDVEAVLDLARTREDLIAYSLPGYARPRPGDPKFVRDSKDILLLKMTQSQRRLFSIHGQVLVLDSGYIISPQI